jgi:hypothetical protein
MKIILLKGWLLKGQSNFLQLKNIGIKHFIDNKVLCPVQKIVGVLP